MEKILKSLLLVAILSFTTVSCEKKEDPGTPPELPPQESMQVDFGNITTSKKAMMDLNAPNSSINVAAAGVTVLVWNAMLSVTLAVPVAAFAHSFSNSPVFIGDATWQWSYDVNALGGTYKARLTGTIRTSDVKWEMYLSKTGVGAFEEFKWFEGTSNLDGNSGQWILYHSYEVQEQVIQIDWQKEGTEVGSITYTYIRESNNGDPNQLVQNSYLSYGLTTNDYNAFYNIHFAERDEIADGFKDVNIEVNTTTNYGRIKAEHYFQDTDWHCWDGDGVDITCN